MKRSITPAQFKLLAGILAVSNCGTQVTGPHADRSIVRAIEFLRTHPLSENYVNGEYAVQIAASLIESDEMEDGFRAEGQSWLSTLAKMSDEKIKATWPDAWQLAVGGAK